MTNAILSDIYLISVLAVPAIIAITMHEAAHGYVAWKFGDDTALRLGRVTFNPLRHIDPFGTIILPGLLLLVHAPFLFGYAKPVPVNFRRLDNPRRDMVWVALAGPGTNVALALAAGFLAHVLPFMPNAAATWLGYGLAYGIIINLSLAALNMIPLPPLDGGRVAVGLLPDGLAFPLARTERYGIPILLGLLILLPMIGERLGVNLDVVRWVIGSVVEFLFNLVESVTRSGAILGPL
jgi:Zn-dependent protease